MALRPRNNRTQFGICASIVAAIAAIAAIAALVRRVLSHANRVETVVAVDAGAADSGLGTVKV